MRTRLTAILANGSPPSHELALRIFRAADHLIACDGAWREAVALGRAPDEVVGDGDSLGAEGLAELQRLGIPFFADAGQDDNDLCKAFRRALDVSETDGAVVLLGTTGRREDHALGNIFHLTDFAEAFRRRHPQSAARRTPAVVIVTDSGAFEPVLPPGATLDSEPGQPVSVFAPFNGTEMSSEGLEWPLAGVDLNRLWSGTLNRTTARAIMLRTSHPVVVYRPHLQSGGGFWYISHLSAECAARKDNMQTPEDFLEANGFVSQQLGRSALVATFLKEMEAGLKGEPSSLAMIPTYVSPSGELKRDTPVAVLDAGGTNLRAGTVSFPSGSTEAKIEHLEKGAMPGTSAYVAPDDFYGTFAAHLERTKPFAGDPAVGFCFSYACEAAPDGDAKLLHWTKQIQAPEIVGQWIGAELKKRLSFAPSKLLVLNDTVTALLAGKACEKPGQRFSAYIGFILGTGTNVAYVQKTGGIAKLAPGEYPAEMIVNSESGGFAKIAQSKFDEAMDAKSRDKGCQVFEKMISGAYLGAIGLEIFKAAAKAGFFSDAAAKQIAALQALESMHLDNFCARFDNGKPNPLDKVFADATDAAMARRLATPVFERAAILTAIHLAAFIVKTGGGSDRSAPVCVCVDGSTYHKTRVVSFPQIVQRELDQMLGPRNVAFSLMVCPGHAPMVGAAVAALLR